jgi:hypothetical protein
MTLADELHEVERKPESRDVVVACADIARRALATDDLALAVDAKQHETQVARGIGMHQHAVVVCAEMLELWPRLAALPELPSALKNNLVWTLKHGAGSAMDLPEIPLATVRDLIAQLEAILGHFDGKRIAVWSLEARLAHIEEDLPTLHDRLDRIMPTLGVSNHAWHYADCPGCMIASAIEYLGRSATPEAAEAVIAPLATDEPFAADAANGKTLRLLFGSGADKTCKNAKRSLPIKLARVYTWAGDLAKARRHVEVALRENATEDHEQRLRASVAALELGVAMKAHALLDKHLALATQLMADLEDPYDQLEAARVAHRAAAILDRADERERLREQALALAKRVDARLAIPRHVRLTLDALALP